MFLPYSHPRIIRKSDQSRPSQHGFTNGRSCLTNLISFYDKVTCLVDELNAVDVVYLDFDTVPHSILVEKMAAHGLDGHMLRWPKHWLNARPKELWSVELNPVDGQS